MVTGVAWVETGALRWGDGITLRRLFDYNEEVRGLWWVETGFDKFKYNIAYIIIIIIKSGNWKQSHLKRDGVIDWYMAYE